MKLFGVFIAAFFAILGAFALLNEFVDHLGKPRKWTSISRQRRSLLGLVFSFFTAIIYGGHSWINEKIKQEEKRKKKEALSVLTDLEVNLFHIVGLVQNAIASENYGAPVNEIKKLIVKLVQYGAKLDKYTKQYVPGPLLPISGHGEVAESIHKIKMRIFSWQDTTERPNVEQLSSLLADIVQARIGIRNAINECQSDWDDI